MSMIMYTSSTMSFNARCKPKECYASIGKSRGQRGPTISTSGQSTAAFVSLSAGANPGGGNADLSSHAPLHIGHVVNFFTKIINFLRRNVLIPVAGDVFFIAHFRLPTMHLLVIMRIGKCETVDPLLIALLQSSQQTQQICGLFYLQG